MEIGQTIIQVLEGLGLLVAGATVLARLTKTQKDDNAIEKVRKILEKISNLFLPDRKK